MNLDWVDKMRELENTENNYVEAWWKLKKYGEDKEIEVKERFKN